MTTIQQQDIPPPMASFSTYYYYYDHHRKRQITYTCFRNSPSTWNLTYWNKKQHR